MAALIPEHVQGQAIEFWFQDEARVGQKGTLTRLWAKRGTRPRMKRDQRHTAAYLFGAVCPARDTGVALILPGVNQQATRLHLAEIAKEVPPNTHAIVILDGAGWHQPGGPLHLPDNLSLLPLPPYSPELNAQENIWQYLRQNFLAGRIFESYDAIVNTCSTAWNALIQEPGRIRSIASRSWLPCVNS